MNKPFFPLNHDLLSKLIGLIRLFQNNEDLLTNSSYLLVLKVLVTNDTNLLEELYKEKHNIVPNCFSCQIKCGKNDDYDISNLYKQDKKF